MVEGRGRNVGLEGLPLAYLRARQAVHESCTRVRFFSMSV